MSTLFELSNEILSVEQALEDLDGESEDMVAVVDEYLEGIKWPVPGCTGTLLGSICQGG